MPADPNRQLTTKGLTPIGLRVDVDTLRGTRRGVPELVRRFAAAGVKASFFFSVGPDNMGRNLYRLLRPRFLWKMLRSRAPSLYGWDILLMGTLGPGPRIGEKAGAAIRLAAEAGHEIGLHAWDHYRWQNFLDRLPAEELAREFERAYQSLAELTGKPPAASANPAWRSSPAMLKLKERYPFLYNSDCRGDRIFLPRLEGGAAKIPQVPTTLPTFDELVGTGGITLENYNSAIWSRLQPGRLNVYTLHAEVEGIAYPEMFSDLMRGCRERGYELSPLSSLLPAEGRDRLPCYSMEERELMGRDGKVAMAVVEEREDLNTKAQRHEVRK
jgi:undecaprenyl phosphate-alpha-L-ara4FN deformylase